MARKATKSSRQAPKATRKEPVYESSSEESEETEYLSLKENQANRDDSEEEDEVFNLDGVDDDEDEEEEDDDEEDESDEDDDDSENDDDDEDAHHLKDLVNNLPANLRQKIVQGKNISDSEDDEELSEEEEAETSWGKKKKNYYTGDTADLEIGQEFEDAQEEEEEAKELYKSSMANKLESDFIDDDGEESEEEYGGEKDDLMKDLEALAKGQNKGKASVEKIARDINKLSKKQRLDIISRESPELLALTEELKQRIAELKHKITPLRELYASAQPDGVEDELAQYLEVKQQLMLSYCVNIVFYLAMKAEGRSVASHPVMKRLLELRYIIEKMRPIDGKLKYQIDRFLTTPVAEQSKSHPNLKAMMEDDDSEASDEEEAEKSNVYRPPKMQAVYYEHENKMEKMDKKIESKRRKIKNSEIMETLNEEFGHTPEVSSSSGVASKSRTEKELVEEENERRNFEEERFIRLTLSRKDKKSIKKRQAEAKQNDLLGDIGDIGDFDELADLVSQTETATAKTPSSALNTGNITAAMQKAVNSFAQTNKKQKLSVHDDVEDSLSEAAALMKAKRKAKMQEAAAAEDTHAMEEYDEYDAMLNDRKRRRAPEMDDESDDNDFGAEYSSDDDNLVEDFAKLKKGFQKEKKDHYTVDARYGGREDLVEDGKRRAATYEIMTNRGLRPHRPKENRNPRVKKRLAYGKAVKARKGQVREAVAGAAGSYGGEMTGIKSGISRSRKIEN